MLAGSDLDAVIVCHSGSHRDSVLSALVAGVHVLVEKPLAWNMREAGEIAEAAASSDRVVQVGYHKLYDPGFAYARDQLQQIDDLAFAECTVLHAADEFNRAPYAILKGDGLSQFNYDLPDWAALQQNMTHWLTTGEPGALTHEALGEQRGSTDLQVAFGLLTISIIHQIYVLFGFLGDPVRVLNTRIWRGGASLHVLIQFPDDVHCALNWHNLPYLNDYRETYAFYGSRRRVTLEMPGPYYRNFPSPVVVQGGDGELSWEKRVTVSFREAFHNELLAFADSIHNGTPPVSSVESAVKHTRFIEAIIAAAR
jgi:predicted dehydrogenase